MKPQCGLIGQQISESLSPFIHEKAQEYLGKNLDYGLFSLKETEVTGFLDKFWQEGGLGLNVTSPYKGLVARLIKSPLKSVNTLWRGKNYWSACSSDIRGLESFLLSEKKSLLSYEHIFCLGAGGVVCALTDYLDKFALKQLNINYFSRQALYSKNKLTRANKNLIISSH